MSLLRATVQRRREKEQKQQHINSTENILINGGTTCVWNYDQKSSDKLDNFACNLAIDDTSRNLSWIAILLKVVSCYIDQEVVGYVYTRNVYSNDVVVIMVGGCTRSGTQRTILHITWPSQVWIDGFARLIV